MKRTKKSLVCVLFCSIMLGSLSFAAPVDYIGGYGEIRTSEVIFSEGTADGILSAGETVNISLGAIKKAGEAENAILAVTVFENKIMIDMKTTPGTIGNTKTDFSAEVTIPSESLSENPSYEISVSLLSAKGGLKPLSAPAFYPSKAEQKYLSAINVSGKALEGFEPEKTDYSYLLRRTNYKIDGTTIPNKAYPEISIYAGDGGTKADISFAEESGFPGKAVVGLNSADGAKTLDYEIAFEMLTHVVMGAGEFSTDDGAADGIVSANEVVSGLGDGGGSAITKNVYGNLHGADDNDISGGSRWMFSRPANSEQYTAIRYVAEDLEGFDYIAPNGGGQPAVGSGTYFEFTLEEDTELVLLMTNAAGSNFSDYTEESGELYLKASYLNSPFVKAMKEAGLPVCYGSALAFNTSDLTPLATWLKENISEYSENEIEDIKMEISEKLGDWTNLGLAIGGTTEYKFRYSKVIEATPQNPVLVTIPVPANAQSKGMVAVLKPL